MGKEFIEKISKLDKVGLLTKLTLMQVQNDVVLDIIYAWENSRYSADEMVDKIKEKLDPEHTWKPLDENDKGLTNAELEEMKKKYGLK